MTKSSTLLALAAAAFSSLVAARDPKCAFFHIPDWECDVCGGYNVDAPIVCKPFNATFEDLPAGKPVGNYDSANWTNFIVATPGKVNDIAPHVRPYSTPNYAVLPAGKAGNVSFTGQFPEGRIYSLHYACATPITHSPTYYLAAPTACEVTVTAKCLPYIQQPDPANETTETFTLDYEPMGYPASNMTFKQGPWPNSTQGVCTSFTFEAKSKFGTPVDFLIDEVLYNSYVQGFAK